MKNITRLSAALAAASLLILLAVPVMAVTNGIEVIGEEAGLVLLPEEGKLFDLGNMNPGDTRQATIGLRNDYSTWYHLWVRAGDVTADEPSLFEVMELTINYGDELLYQGPVQGFAAGEEALYLGRYEPGESGELVVTVHLPGPETGNEYQGKSASVKWIFSAQASDEIIVEPEEPGLEPEEPGPEPGEIEIPPEKPGLLPQTFGEGALYAVCLLGLLLLLFGVPLVRGRKQGN